MSKSLFSQSWYRVSGFKPALRAHVEIHRHRYRGETWFVIQDRSTGRFHRFTPEAYQVIGLLDGMRSLQEIWEIACDKLGDDMPTQDEVISLLSQLHQSEVLQSDLLPDMENMLVRQRKSRRNKWLQNIKSPLSLKLPLLDPESFLKKIAPLGNFLFSRVGGALFTMLLALALVLAGMHWEPLTGNLADRVFAAENVLLLFFVYPVVKIIHEFGHALAVQRWGGEVHEMGVMFLVFMPIPYVDASSSSSFRDKYKRMLVAAAGILVELGLAALAMIVWAHAEEGIVRAIAFNVLLIAGVSTVLFNGNPLLRFDAYYILADYIEIPNLAQRSNNYLGYLIKRYLLKVRDLDSPAYTKGEARWMVFYSIASFMYRMSILVFIVVFVASKFFFIGVVLAIWAMITMLIMPAVKVVAKAYRDPSLARYRRKITLVGSGFIGLVLVLVLLVPFPLNTVVEGVVLAPEQSEVRVGTTGTIDKVLVKSGSRVKKGDLLVRCVDEEVEVLVRKLEAELIEYQARYRAAYNDLIQSGILREEIARVQGELAHARKRQQALSIRSPVDGVFLLANENDLEGMYVKRGQSLGYVISKADYRVRALVTQDDIDLVRNRTEKVWMRTASAMNRIVPVSIRREMPAVSSELPSPVLSIDGGGKFALNPQEKGRKVSAYERLYQFELAIPGNLVVRVGDRVYVRFAHDMEPLAWRWFRGLRRVFLRHFDV